MEKRILIIEDDESMAKYLSRVLVKQGYSVILAFDGEEGMRRFSTEKVDLILTDVFMPVSDGIDFMIELRKKNENVKVIAMSGGSKALGDTDFFLNVTKDFGAHAVLRKPFSNDELIFSISSLLSAV